MQPSSSTPSTVTSRPPSIPSYHNWTCDDVTKWLTDELQLSQYVDVFRENEIDGAELPSLTSDVLQKDLNIRKIKLNQPNYS